MEQDRKLQKKIRLHFCNFKSFS